MNPRPFIPTLNTQACAGLPELFGIRARGCARLQPSRTPRPVKVAALSFIHRRSGTYKPHSCFVLFFGHGVAERRQHVARQHARLSLPSHKTSYKQCYTVFLCQLSWSLPFWRSIKITFHHFVSSGRISRRDMYSIVWLYIKALKWVSSLNL